jgi:uncharacterized protein (TIGR01777 family)
MKRIVIAGGSGFLGRVLIDHLGGRGFEVVNLSRFAAGSRAGCRQVAWDGKSLGPWSTELEGAEAVVNLAGRSVDCRYHERNRRQILDSRIEPTRVLGQAIARGTKPPRVWLNSSTATIYKHTFGPAWNEEGEIGGTPEVNDLFSVEVAQAWERELNIAVTPRTRKIALRTAMVLGHGANSVFPVLRRLIRCGLGGRMGSGQQFVSWIHQADFCRALDFILAHDELAGSLNLAAPTPLTNQEMMSTLRQLCHVPAGLPATRWLLEIGAFLLRTETELILKSRRVVPGRLLNSGF